MSSQRHACPEVGEIQTSCNSGRMGSFGGATLLAAGCSCWPPGVRPITRAQHRTMTVAKKHSKTRPTSWCVSSGSCATMRVYDALAGRTKPATETSALMLGGRRGPSVLVGVASADVEVVVDMTRRALLAPKELEQQPSYRKVSRRQQRPSARSAWSGSMQLSAFLTRGWKPFLSLYFIVNIEVCEGSS